MQWVHHDNRTNCSGLTDSEFVTHCNDQDRNKPFECDSCKSKSKAKPFFTLPFANLDDSFCFNDNSEENILNSLEVKEFIAQCESIQNCVNIDDDDLPSSVNSKYFDITQLNSLKLDLPSSFGLFHVNIASLNKHIDDLKLILSRLKFKFDVIGISEHKIFKDTLPSNEIKIPGYDEFIFAPTEGVCGGTGFFIKDNLDYVQKPELVINSPVNFESLFIEVIFPKRKNLIVGCIYRHPSSEISVKDFTNLHLEPVLQKISAEKKRVCTHGRF